MGFEKCHPAVNLIYFSAVLFGALWFKHPAFVLISFLCAFTYSVKRNGIKALLFNLCLLPAVVAFVAYYVSYNHFGVTILKKNLIDNNITLESLLYGIVLGISASSAIMWFSCIYSIFSSDKVVYLFGKVSPRLSLWLSMILRAVPKIKLTAKKINIAQKGIGHGADQGNIFRRIKNCLRILSILITDTLEAFVVSSDSMRSRGHNLRGRTAFSIYRFDNRDRAFVIGMFTCITITLAGILLHQTDMLFDPRIIMPTITPVSVIFYIGFVFLCLMPPAMELWTEYQFRKARVGL